MFVHAPIEYSVSSNHRVFAVLFEDVPIDLEYVLFEVVPNVPVIVVVIDIDNDYSVSALDLYGEGLEK